MKLLIENCEDCVYLDEDTKKLQCFELGVTNHEIYFAIIRRFPKYIHKSDPIYLFLDAEILKYKICVNDYRDAETGVRHLTTTYCRNIDMEPMMNMINEHHRKCNKIKMENWYAVRHGKTKQVNPIPKVDLTDERLTLDFCYKGSTLSKFKNFWQQNDSGFVDAVNKKRKGFLPREIPKEIRNCLDFTLKGVLFNREIAEQQYKNYGHGYRPGGNVMPFPTNESSNLLVPFQKEAEALVKNTIPHITEPEKEDLKVATNFVEQTGVNDAAIQQLGKSPVATPKKPIEQIEEDNNSISTITSSTRKFRLGLTEKYVADQSKTVTSNINSQYNYEEEQLQMIMSSLQLSIETTYGSTIWDKMENFEWLNNFKKDFTDRMRTNKDEDGKSKVTQDFYLEIKKFHKQQLQLLSGDLQLQPSTEAKVKNFEKSDGATKPQPIEPMYKEDQPDDISELPALDNDSIVSTPKGSTSTNSRRKSTTKSSKNGSLTGTPKSQKSKKSVTTSSAKKRPGRPRKRTFDSLKEPEPAPLTNQKKQKILPGKNDLGETENGDEQIEVQREYIIKPNLSDTFDLDQQNDHIISDDSDDDFIKNNEIIIGMSDTLKFSKYNHFIQNLQTTVSKKLKKLKTPKVSF